MDLKVGRHLSFASMWKSSFRAWFYFSISAAIVVSLHTTDVYWLILEIGIMLTILGRWPLFDQPEEPELQRPLTVFMVLPFSIYVLIHITGQEESLFLGSLGTLTKMMATLLLCLFVNLILVKRTTFQMNYRFILGFSTATAISLAAFFDLLTISYNFLQGMEISNSELMWSLTSILIFGIASGALFKRDMRRMDYSELLMVRPREERGA
jgi:hypothetical protein